MGSHSIGEVVVADFGICLLLGQLLDMSPFPGGFIELNGVLTEGFSIQKLKSLCHHLFDIHTQALGAVPYSIKIDSQDSCIHCHPSLDFFFY